ncbi:FecR family protein [Pseudomonas sp. LJDD11]|uniref:FecR family protein n=1 Tax=unclassified Pseudomonas TaxID=196821 RepID=UPI0004F83AF1|nr:MULTISPECIES: FecR family protein [unclassified Pseudomonas]MCO8165201.1 FecR family protein [Pseudomonas sp. 21LCFQ010]MCQ9427093.1 FecR family protein [Pseudomonas sp. LJDD11]BAP45349.1 anti-sigma factor protein, FecR family [Pseudomonas sp. StFLB209]
MKARQLPPAVAQAVEWLALQRSGTMSDGDRQRFEHWLHASPEHSLAWQQLQQRIGQVFSGTPQSSREMLDRAGNSRRHLLRGALGLSGVGLAGWWLQGQGLLPGLGADLQTAIAQRQRFDLADGSRVLLNADSRVDLLFDGRQRTLLLRQGALNIEVARDPERPLVVRTAFGEARALGTRFSVALHEQSAQVWVQQSHVLVSVPGAAPLQLRAGQGAQLDGRRVQALDPQLSRAAAWEDGRLEVHDRPVSEVIEALRAYHPGWLRISAEAAALRVTGIFPLDDSPQALRILQEVLPVRVERPLSWWTQVSLR